MERIYRFLELEMEPAVPAMEDYLERAKALKRHPHRYSLAEFGLDSGEVAERTADYVRTYGIAAEENVGHLAQRRRAARSAS